MARRQTQVHKNLSDTLKLFGVISFRSCGLVVVVNGLLQAIELMGHPLARLLGDFAGIVLQFAITGAVAVALAWIERYTDEYHVPSAIRFFVQRDWRYLYSAARNERGPRQSLECVLRA